MLLPQLPKGEASSLMNAGRALKKVSMPTHQEGFLRFLSECNTPVYI